MRRTARPTIYELAIIAATIKSCCHPTVTPDELVRLAREIWEAAFAEVERMNNG